MDCLKQSSASEVLNLLAGGVVWIMCASIDLLEVCLPHTLIIIAENKLEAATCRSFSFPP